MNKTIKFLLAYLLGNAVQILLHLVSKNTYMMRPVLFCIAAGVLIFALILFGAGIGGNESKPKHYAEYAEVSKDV